jgi:hypothetical protein
VTAQSALGTFNGRVVDEAEAVLPGVTVTATNADTNVTRTTVTNEQGLFNLPGLEPGVYAIRAELTGFASWTQTEVRLPVSAAITMNIKMSVAAVTESITVTGASPLVEVTRSEVAATVRAREVANLPLITRHINALYSLLPGAKPVAALNVLVKRQWGSVSFGGGTGRNMIQTVDGGDNRDYITGGPALNYTVEGIEEFRVSSHRFSAADGRASGSAVTIVTKSGTNAFRGSGFVYARDRSLTEKDYFTSQADRDKLPFSRQQYGGSLGGPILHDRAFFFTAVEGIHQDRAFSVPDRQFNELQLLTPFGAQPARVIEQPYRETLVTAKANVQLNPRHSLLGRYSQQLSSAVNAQKDTTMELSWRQTESIPSWDAVVQHNWLVSNRTLNQLTLYTNHIDARAEYNRFFSDWPNVARSPATQNLIFPSVRTGQTATLTGFTSGQDNYQIRNDLTTQVGGHALKIGGGYVWLPHFGGELGPTFDQFTFFDDPSVILSNSNGRYPQGFQTPGIVSQWLGSSHIRHNNFSIAASQVRAWVQDDWRVSPRVTLNLGVRYDLDFNFYNQNEVLPRSPTGIALRDIGDPRAALPRAPKKDISPRTGFAYDLGGDGRRVVRGGYGLYFDGMAMHGRQFEQGYRPIMVQSRLVNSAIGVGQLATYRFGIDPPPASPPAVIAFDERFPAGARTTGYWFDPRISDPYSHQMHIGYAHQLGPNTMLSADYTRSLMRNEFRYVEINGLQNGVRRLAPSLW